ncbi:GntR family transcriptional regulator [Clostridium chromiireducens]|uniref:HTH-type transcriptional regulator McbR n=1 Tax=Clostridium chromiireducens TaxID=225345 RepID=A0A1V4IRT7_9CLOT|nr:GntR family transcriptional regulator [Clostridium chromiireducens]OPJ62515.1 HTH-type transcriptional regulator McbR [Clostridium chromiireducens]
MNFSERLKNENAKEYAYRVLKSNIMSLELRPGQKISESELEQQLNISRTPIREILIRLREEDLIEVKPQQGTYVSLLKMEYIEEAFFMSYHLEKEVLKLACDSFPKEKLIELERNLIEQKFILEKQDKKMEFNLLDSNFHEIIFSGVNFKKIWKTILKISTHYNRFRFIPDLKYGSKYFVEKNEKIFYIIKNRDSVAIEPLLLDYLNENTNQLRQFLEENHKYKGYFKQDY